jgi:ATP-binding protein involved in chromosome partitioning
MVTREQVEEALTRVMDPELGRNIIELGMLRDLQIQDSSVAFTLVLTIPDCPLRDQIAADARAAVAALAGVRNVAVTLGAMSESERAAVLGQSQSPASKTSPNVEHHIGRVVAVASGKGGVGKSSVTALLAVALARANYRVGILDADVTGPSIPRLFGLHDAPKMSVMGMLPPQTELGIKIMSINLLLPSEDEAVIWRGPIVSQVIQQFWNEVLWGELDYLLVDLPPGTSDAPLTVMQSLSPNGIVLVTTPQDLAAMVVRKARRMADQMQVPILGVVENMSAFVCPTCGTRHELFGSSHAEEIADAPLLARLSIAPDLATLGDAGSIELYESDQVASLAEAFLDAVPLHGSAS